MPGGLIAAFDPSRKVVTIIKVNHKMHKITDTKATSEM